MIVTYSATIAGEVEIDNDELDGMTRKTRQDHIASRVYMAAQEDLDANLDWEVTE